MLKASAKRDDKFISFNEILAFNKIKKFKPDAVKVFEMMKESEVVELMKTEDGKMFIRKWIMDD